jgi:cephalosporin hydroxylase
MKATEKQAVDWLVRSLPKAPGDVLGKGRISCAGCGRQIAAAEARTHCLECGGNFCMTCDRGCDHDLRVDYPGFPEIDDPEVVVELARKHLAEAVYGRFHVNDSIWFSGFKFFIDYLEDQITPGDEPRADVEELAPAVIEWLNANVMQMLSQWVSLKEMGRFVDYFGRRAVAGSLPDYLTTLLSQGMNGPTMWAGRPTMRSVWDFALAPLMMEEIKPRTVIELGTASGGATILFADLQRISGLVPRVISVDIDPPELKHDGVTFLRGDSHRIEETLTDELLAEQPHPWLIIEDAHTNIHGVLEHFDRFVREGDYIVVEDVDAEAVFGRFLSERPGRYKVDTRYTDYFGHNTTCAPDQILRCVDDASLVSTESA